MVDVITYNFAPPQKKPDAPNYLIFPLPNIPSVMLLATGNNQMQLSTSSY